MPESFRNPEAQGAQEDKEKKKGNKLLKQAGAGLLVGSSLSSFLTQDLFAKSKAEAAKEFEAQKTHERVMPEQEMANRSLSFQEFLAKNPQMKQNSPESELAFFEETTSEQSGDETVEGETQRNSPKVFISYTKGRYPVYNEKGLSAFELAMKENIRDTVDYLPEAKGLKNPSKVIGASVDISPVQRWQDFKQNEAFQRGTLGEMIQNKTGKNSKYYNLGIGILNILGGRGGTLGRISQEVNRGLNTQVGNVVLERVTSRTDFYRMDTKMWKGKMVEGLAKYDEDFGQPVVINYAIETTTYSVDVKDPYGRASQRTEVTTYRVLLRPEGINLIDGGTVGMTPQGQWQATKPGQGLTTEKVPVFQNAETLHEFLALNSLNQALYDSYGIDPRSRAGGETNPQFFPVDAAIESAISTNVNREVKLHMTADLQIGQEILLQGPTRNIKVRVLSVEKKPANNGQPAYNEVHVKEVL